MIRFQDERLYVKGTCNAVWRNTQTGDIEYQIDKFQTNNITTSATLDPIRGGLGNPVACIIASDSAVNVAASSAAFSLKARAMQLGAKLSYNGIKEVCQVVTASGTTISVDVDNGTPVAPYGYTSVIGYVLEVNAKNTIALNGLAYTIDPTTGAVEGFVAETGKKYKIWYFIRDAAAQELDIPSMFNPGVYHFTAQMAVYKNNTGDLDKGTRIGWLYVVIPRLALNAVGGVNGDQTANDVTDLSGQALPYDSDVESESCDDCEASHLAYYIYVPDDGADSIIGLAVIGGEVTLPKSSSKQIPVKFVMDDGTLVQPNYADLDYELISPPSGTTVSSSGVITAGATAGDCEANIEYTAGSKTLSVVVNVSITD